MSSDAPPTNPVDDLQVRLKPLFGIEPKVYLAALYGFVVLAVLVGFLIGPGLVNPGARVTFTSVPEGAAMVWKGRHWGVTPLTVYLPQGQGPLVVSKPGFQADQRDFTVGNQVVLSLVFPATDAVAVTLAPQSPTSVTDRFRSEVGRWALTVPFTKNAPFPPLFTRFVVDARAAGLGQDEIRQVLLGLRSAVADPQMYRDYGRALGLWTGEPPSGLVAQEALWEPLVGSDSGRLTLWLLANQAKPDRDREVAEPSDAFRSRQDTFVRSVSVKPVWGPAPVALKAGGQNFRGVGASSYVWGLEGDSFDLPTEPPFALPVAVEVGEFWIADAEVTQAQYAEFVAAQPQWAPAARGELEAAGQADSGYLTDWVQGIPPTPTAPVVAVSWTAAQAYVEWWNASGRAPAGYRAVLPSDLQWEAAARAPGGSSLVNQGAWEWTATAWYPGQSLVGASALEASVGDWARSLKGGNASTKGAITAADRAPWPASGTLPTLGFRLALVRVASQAQP